MTVVLMCITILAVLALVIVLVASLSSIHSVLQRVGGAPDSFLAKLRLGLRAIETETGHLPVEVTKLNGGLNQVSDGLQAVDHALAQAIETALKQEKYK